MSKDQTQKKDFKFWVDKAVSIGAAVVIVGALFKILHWPFANELLIVGMLTEALIFLIYAYLYILLTSYCLGCLVSSLGGRGLSRR
jgi:hypothetical protein